MHAVEGLAPVHVLSSRINQLETHGQLFSPLPSLERTWWRPNRVPAVISISSRGCVELVCTVFPPRFPSIAPDNVNPSSVGNADAAPSCWRTASRRQGCCKFTGRIRMSRRLRRFGGSRRISSFPGRIRPREITERPGGSGQTRSIVEKDDLLSGIDRGLSTNRNRRAGRSGGWRDKSSSCSSKSVDNERWCRAGCRGRIAVGADQRGW